MRVYLAGPYQHKDRIQKCADQLMEAGIVVTSSWLSETHPPNTQLHEVSDETKTEYALRDLKDIDAADWFVLFTVPLTDAPIPRAGRHVEFGYALAQGIPILVVGGVKENIFHYIPSVKHADDWEKGLELLINQAVEAMGL